MKKITMRLIALALLTLVSMGAAAQTKINVQIANDGKFDGGTIEVTGQEEQKEGGVKVTITVSPNSGYTIKKEAIKVYATYPPSGSRADTRDIEIASNLTLLYNGSEKEDVKDASAKRDYTFIVPSGFGAWVKEAKFLPDGSKNTRSGFLGIRYIANDNTSSGHPGKVYSSASDAQKYYLVPAANPQQTSAIDAYYSPDHNTTDGDSEKPFLATALTNKDLNSIWIVTESGESGYYYIIHALTGKYVIYEVPLPNDPNKNTDGNETNNGKRKTMHLQTIDNGDYNPLTNDNFKFAITTSGSGYNIRPKNRTGWYWNPAGQNNGDYYGQASGENPNLYRNGLVGVYNNTGTNSIWHFEDASSATTLTPVISDVEDGTNNFTITSPAAAFSTIHYTTDGSTIPDASTGETATSSKPITINESWTVQAVGVFGSFVTPVAGPKALEPVGCAIPVITFDYTTSNVSISCTSLSSTIYYTTDGSTPTTSSTQYSTPFPVNSPTTVKAIATHATLPSSSVAELTITQVEIPTIQNNGSNAISITSATPGATIYYTTDDTNPTTASSQYTEPLTDNVSNVTIKAIAVKENMITSAVGSGSVKLQCATPVITRNGLIFTLSCSMPTNATLYYTLEGGSETLYSGPVAFTTDQLPMTVTAIARHSDYTESGEASMELTKGTGTPEDPFLISGDSDFSDFITNVKSGTVADKCFKLISDVSASGADAITMAFTGTFDGGGYTISGLSHPLFNTVDGGVVKNVTLKNVAISSSDEYVGAIAGIAQGYSRIYNCGILPNDATFPEGTHPTVSGGTCAGGIVGKLDGDSRVINCYSYADVSATTYAAGIVGQNTFASTAEVSGEKYTKLKTAVVNCMFYGNITGGTNQYGVYGGSLITNAAATGISSYNYYRSGSTFNTSNGIPTAYNCSFPAEERYLTQVEFHRSLLNSNRELCGWWVGSDVAPSTLTTAEVQAIPKDASLMYKWVVDPNVAPYPILKPFGKYASVINSNTGIPWVNRATANPFEGKQLGTLTVNVNSGSHSSAASQTLSIPITDMDTLRYDFGYRKIQLPYYNTVFGNPSGTTWQEKYAGNYTNQVVTGWKITAVETDGTVETYNSFVADWQDGYNFADRKCTEKDLYSKSGRVFAQGGNYYVPDGVTSITIEAYWGKAIYVRNEGGYYDRVNITLGNTGSAFAPAGTRGNNVNDATIQTTTKLSDALKGTNIDAKKTVYDYALVLVGNVQESVGKSDVKYSTSDYRGFTIMSVDLDFDEEPDYCLEWQLGENMARQVIAPIRFDFLPVVELGIAGKLHNSTNFYSLGCYRSQGHFEVTETSFIRFGQFEFELGTRDEGPVILNGGIYDQYCRGRNGEETQNINYVILGGHIVMPSFTPGAHVNSAAKYQTRHCAVNALGGDFTSFYLTGGYNEGISPYEDNPHCYIDGGRFGTVAAAYKEGIWGDVTWRINHALIGEFYGGGVMAQKDGTTYKIVKGSIDVVIDNSIVGKYCGGPKFGDMEDGKTVTTSATGTTFNQFFGAGNGGTNYVQYKNTDTTGSPSSANWGSTVSSNYHPAKYRNTAQGYEADYDIEVINPSTGDKAGNVVNRSYYYSAQFATTNTGNVTSTLTDCTINTNFYGGGFLGGVTGNVTSTLNNCTVKGAVFGAGYSASAGTIKISNTDKTPPVVNTYTGMIKPQTGGTSTTYYWTHDKGSTSSPITAATETDPQNYFYTEIPLDNLGTVSGNVTLTINGVTTTVGESVYGGGEESVVNGNTTVTVTGGTIGTTGKGGATWGNVFGGGKGKEEDVTAGLVKGNTTVSISGSPTIIHNIYGGGAYGSVGDFTYDATTGMPTALATANTGACTVTITGGTFGSNGHENGMVFGSSRGDVAVPGTDGVDPNDRMAWVYSTHVTIGDANAETSPTIKGSVYGSGENGHTFQNTIVDINKGIIGITDTNVDGGAAYAYRGNVYGGGCGTDMYDSNNDGTQDKYNPLAGIVKGTTTINIAGGQVVHNVYGAGAMGSVGGGAEDTSGKTTINITGGRIGYDGDGNGHVFGAARGEFGKSTAASGLANVRETEVNINYTTTPTADNEGKTAQLIAGSVFGGGEAGTVKESVAVNMTGGLVLKDVYGGGALADTQTSNWDASANENAGDWANAGQKSALHTTTVRLTGGRVGEEVYGGGLGEAGKPAYVWGDVLVDLNGTTSSDETGSPIANDAKGCAVGQIFGCNNVNGTPKGDVMVHVYATQNAAATQIANTTEVTTAKVKGRYDVTAVYGGGNQAAYNPVTPSNGTSGSKTKVIIEGCSLTSIETVYGGGNAAAVPETDVVIKGAYEIGYLFGGGNGKDDIAPGVPNPGADVGTLDHGATTYGTGNANTLMEGGLIHEAYGGSNTKGIIKGSLNQTTAPKASTDPEYCCDLEVEKIVGAGKYADVDGDVNMTLSCQPESKVNLLFAGADEANVNGNITLNITNGHFGKVFGGNNLGGVVKGKIMVNVEETGCQPIKIDDLYLGGNEAAYSVFGYYESEEIHPVTGKNILKPRTSADDTHTPVANPATDATHSFPYAQPELNIISCTYIGNVFGGGFGEGAVMYANPTVNVNMVKGAFGDDEDKGVPKVMTELGLDVTKTAPNPNKLGIIRNVFGGGDAANIAGDTHVNIATEEGKSAYIIGSVFGGGNAADVLGNTNVTVSGGYVFNGIFGGGYAGSVGTFTRSMAEADVNIYGHTTHTGCIGKPISCAEGTGKCTVVVDGGQIGPLSVATEGMNRSKADDGPVPEGWVWGAGQGLVEDPAEHPDTHFTSYVGSTDVTIGGTALIMESIIGGGEFGRVLGNTLVKIEGGQIGIGEGKVDGDNKPIRYKDDQFVNPLTTTITDANALTECSHYPYGKNIGTTENPNWVYLPYDPYCEKYPDYFAAHPEFAPASTSNPSDGKTWIGCVFAGGSGYMPYEKKDGTGYDWCPSAGLVEGDAEVRISGGHILTNVYGGNEITDVKGTSNVKMTGGTIGVPRTLEQIVKHPLTCYLFGAGKGDERSRFYNYTNTGSVEVEISGGIIYGSVFGGSEDGHVTGDIKMDIKPGAIIGTWGTSYVDGNVFGGGRGFSGNTLTAGNVGGNVTMNISGGNILGSIYGGGRLASVGTYLVETTDANYGKQIPDVGDDKHGHITINISGGTIGNDKEYIYNPTAAQKAVMPNTTFDYLNHLQYTKGGNVFTAGMGRLYALDNTTVLTSWQKLGQCKSTTLNMSGGTVKSSVYGGGEIGIVAQNATLNIDGGTVGTKVVDSKDATKYYYFGSVFGGGKGSTENIDGISAAGTTQGDVEVHLNKTVASNDAAKGAIVHQVFGCNDMNGSPKGTVTVHVYATQNADKDNISTKYDKGTEKFDVEAVYGGGNLAAYEPEGGKNTTKSTKVIIDGCGLTSIKHVYGGGNAASTPATNVEVNGTYEILELFGGGNGLDKLPDGRPNPGANVGYKNYTVYTKDGEDKWVASDDPAYDTKEERTAGTSGVVYGTGQASVNVFGGTVHRVFGGSNTKGNVRQTAVTLLDENGACEFCVDEAYGGGKSAPMDAEAKLLMACIPGLQAAYGGAEAAEIQGNVTLNITNGTFDRVFGGNNLSGTIRGSITVNIEEIGCRPIKIGELYGGGNQAGYSVYGYNDDGTPKETGTKLYADPQVNVMSFTSIGKVFGGGYGVGATMVGNPTVNVNEVYGKYYDDDRSIVGEDAKTPGDYPIPSHAKGKMGAISEVFGGGNAAKVMGNTTVNVATLPEVYIVKQVTAGAALPEGCYIRNNDGTYSEVSGTASADVTYYEKKDVLGVDIRGNVYGGGNKADVTGSTNVVVGKKSN